MATKPSYKPLSTKDDDEEEEELTIYDRKFGQGAYEENVELIFRQRKGRRQNNTKSLLYYNNNRILACFAVILVALLIAIITGYALWMVSSSTDSIVPPTSPPSIPVNQSTSVPITSPTTPVISSTDTTTWRAEFHDGMSENSVHLSDINSDGIPDVITADVTTRFLNPSYDHCHGNDDTHDKCMDEFGYSPCQTRLLALNGNSGEILWDTWVEYSVFAINCRTDLNLDGHSDCLFAGRTAGFSAYDVYNHRLLWIVDSSITCVAYNYYFPLITKDFDKDGIPDIIVVHGGDPRYADSTKNRTPGFLVVVSGATGEQLSEHILTPDNHESYSSPIVYTAKDDISLILFGSGGETVSGSLWALSLESLSNNVQRFTENKGSYTPNKEYKFASCYSKSELASSRPQIDHSVYSTSRHDDWMKSCPVLPGNNQPIWNKYELCVYEFIPAGSAGTMLPPVTVDVNKDGVMDLLVSQFNDHTLLYDGATGNIIWNYVERSTQTYSIPTLLHFNDDNTLDVLLRLNKGRWMDYDYSFISVLDGNSGNSLWTFNCTIATMSSPIILQSKVKGHDAMLFLGAACAGNNMGTEGDEGEQGEENKSHQREGESGKKKRSIKRSSHTCPRRFFDFENLVMNKRRTQYHHITSRDTQDDSEFLPMNHEGSGNHHHDDDDTSHTTSPSIDDYGPVMDDISQYIPKDLWIVRNSSDHFPNPWDSNEGLESFIKDYCNLGSADNLEVSLYYVTPQMITGKEEERRGPIPLDSFRPYVHKPSSVKDNKRSKRHGGGHTPSADSEFETIKSSLLQNRKGLRCAHIMLPFMTAGTPAITDLNSDGKFEIVTIVMYSPLPGDYSRPVFQSLHPPKTIVESFTLDTRLQEIGINIEDSSLFYPLNKQPWTQYMGKDGNGVYK